MPATDPIPIAKKSSHHIFRVAGVVLLAVGVLLSGGLYWLGIRAQSASELPTIDDSKQLSYRVELNVGKVGLLMGDAQDALKNPKVQALLVFVLSAVAATICFYIARVEERKSLRR